VVGTELVGRRLGGPVVVRSLVVRAKLVMTVGSS
jgi:hypothetical protein